MRNYAHKASINGRTAYRTPSSFRIRKKMQVEILKSKKRKARPWKEHAPQ